MVNRKDWEDLLNSPENKIKFNWVSGVFSLQVREEIRLKFQWSPIALKMQEELLKKDWRRHSVKTWRDLLQKTRACCYF